MKWRRGVLLSGISSEEGYLKLFLKNHIEMIELGGGEMYKNMKKDDEVRLKFFYNEKDSIKNLINKTPKDEINRIEIVLNYRERMVSVH